MSAFPKVEAIKCKQFVCAQSKYEHTPKLPVRALVVAPSGAGKTPLLVNLILDVYRGCFSRIYIFSPSVHLDHVWDPAKEYIEQKLHVDPSKEPYAFDRYDPRGSRSDC